MVVLVRMILRNYSGCFLPATVVAELELNSVNPPPDMIEEDKRAKKLKSLEANNLREQPVHAKQLKT